jgi:hypothetical protein
MKPPCPKCGREMGQNMERWACPRCGVKEGYVPTNEQFIFWARKKLEEPASYQAAVVTALKEAQDFYRNDPSAIIPQVIRKLEKGAQEHGAPVYDPAEIAEQLRQEHVDLVGWLLIRWFNAEREG